MWPARAVSLLQAILLLLLVHGESRRLTQTGDGKPHSGPGTQGGPPQCYTSGRSGLQYSEGKQHGPQGQRVEILPTNARPGHCTAQLAAFAVALLHAGRPAPARLMRSCGAPGAACGDRQLGRRYGGVGRGRVAAWHEPVRRRWQRRHRVMEGRDMRRGWRGGGAEAGWAWPGGKGKGKGG